MLKAGEIRDSYCKRAKLVIDHRLREHLRRFAATYRELLDVGRRNLNAILGDTFAM